MRTLSLETHRDLLNNIPVESPAETAVSGRQKASNPSLVTPAFYLLVLLISVLLSHHPGRSPSHFATHPSFAFSYSLLWRSPSSFQYRILGPCPNPHLVPGDPEWSQVYLFLLLLSYYDIPHPYLISLSMSMVLKLCCTLELTELLLINVLISRPHFIALRSESLDKGLKYPDKSDMQLRLNTRDLYICYSKCSPWISLATKSLLEM